MKDYLLLYRADFGFKPGGTVEEAQAITGKWMEWMNSIEASGKLASRGNKLANTGRVLKAGKVTDGPYAEIKELIGGFSIVKAINYEEATELASGCPILQLGGNVEVREIAIV